MYRRAFLYCLLIVCSLLSTSFAEIQYVEVDDSVSGSWIVTVKDGKITSRPFPKVIKLNSGPINPPDTEPTTPVTPATEFIKTVKTETQTVLSNGGTKTTGAALASVYSIVGDRVANGEITLAQWPTAIRAASDALLVLQDDKAKWTDFRKRLSESFTVIQSKGLLDTKDEVAQALRDVATGMNQATGFSSARHLAKDARAEKGILDGIDIVKIMQLIELIMKILEAFNK